jgi:hypothetical protein
MKKLLLLSLVFVGCQSGSSFVLNSSVDKVTNETSVYSTGNYFKTKPFGANMSLDLQTDDYGTPKSASKFIFNYSWAGWLFIQKGESLVFNVDGTVITLNSQLGSVNREIHSGSNVEEYAVYDMDKAKLSKIANGKVVIGKVIGKEMQLEFEVSKKNQENFLKMLQYVK